MYPCLIKYSKRPPPSKETCSPVKYILLIPSPFTYTCAPQTEHHEKDRRRTQSLAGDPARCTRQQCHGKDEQSGKQTLNQGPEERTTDFEERGEHLGNEDCLCKCVEVWNKMTCAGNKLQEHSWWRGNEPGE